MHGQLPMDAATPANRHVVHPDSIMYRSGSATAAASRNHPREPFCRDCDNRIASSIVTALPCQDRQAIKSPDRPKWYKRTDQLTISIGRGIFEQDEMPAFVV